MASAFDRDAVAGWLKAQLFDEGTIDITAWVTQAREQFGLAPEFQAEVELLACGVVAEQLAAAVLGHVHADEPAPEA